jgi:uncharacterized protein
MPPRLIALEEHFRAPALAARVQSDASPGRPVAKLDDLDAQRLADLDAGDIAVQVISHTAPTTERLARDEAIATARAVNDHAAAAVARHPDRLRAFATLPMPAPEAAVEELERAVRELGFCGALINGTTQGRFLDHPIYRPLLGRALELGVPLYLHPAEPPAAVRAAYYADLSQAASQLLATTAWGWHVETGLHVLRLVVAGVFDEFPGLQVIVGHMGEALPFFLARSSRILARGGAVPRGLESYATENLHFTTSGMFTPAPLRCLLDVVGPDRVMFSVDYPYSANDEARDFLLHAPISDRDREKLAHANAERLLGIAPVS